jgi:HlyD family secretion protein
MTHQGALQRWGIPGTRSALILFLLGTAACRQEPPADRTRASGAVEATEVRISAQVGGRLVELKVAEGDRIGAGDLIAQLDTTDVALTLRRARADRDQALAQLRLLEAGSRAEDIRQAEAQVAGAEADAAAATVDLQAAQTDLDRFETLLKANSGSQKQRDDAASRRDGARERLRGSQERIRAAHEVVVRLQRGARPQEIDAARARLASAEAQIATLEQNLSDATLKSPVSGVVTGKLTDVGEMLAPRVPVITVADLDHPWANIYVDEPVVPRVRIGQAATIYTDAGGAGIQGTITFISPKAEFTPRNVQTAAERSKLVYRIKVSVDNRQGVLKQGMPVEADIPLQAAR